MKRWKSETWWKDDRKEMQKDRKRKLQEEEGQMTQEKREDGRKKFEDENKGITAFNHISFLFILNNITPNINP